MMDEAMANLDISTGGWWEISTGDWWERWAVAMNAANDLMERCFKLHESRGLELGLARDLWHAGDLRLVEQCEAMEPDAIASLNSEYRSRHEP